MDEMVKNEVQPSASDVLEQRVALHCSLIGAGNAGNQLLNAAYPTDIEVFALNTSADDLNRNLVSDSIKSFIIGNEGRGAGKNRDTAKELFKYNGQELLTQVPAFTSMIERSDVVFVAGSTAGGTGSMICPILIKFMKQFYPGKIIIYIGITPRKSAAYQEQKNSHDCLQDVINLEVPYILADLDYYKDVPNDVAYTNIQNYILDCINIIRGKYLNKSPYGIIDENDMRTVISEPGYMSIYHLNNVSQAQLDKESMQAMMIKLIKHSPAVDIMRDGIVRQMAAIVNVPEDMTDSSRASNYDELQSYIGKPLAVFENYAVLPMAPHGQMIIILSGQTMPYTRLSQMAQVVKEQNEKYAKQKKFDINSLLADTVDVQKGVPSFLKTPQNDNKTADKKAVNDFFSDL